MEASELEHDCLSIERPHALQAYKLLDGDDALDASENENDENETIGGASEVLKKRKKNREKLRENVFGSEICGNSRISLQLRFYVKSI